MAPTGGQLLFALGPSIRGDVSIVELILKKMGFFVSRMLWRGSI
jgi:hypothetical protein